MIKSILKLPMLSLMVVVSCHTISFGQQAGEPPLYVIWNSLIEHASINEAEVASSSPNYPHAINDDSKLKNWIDSHPIEVESFMGLFEKHEITPSRIQLGIGVRKATYADVVPHWPNALSAYGSKSEIVKQLPHMPAPEAYCPAEDYLKDQQKFNSWRGDYTLDVGDNFDADKAPDLNELFDAAIYPCLAQYNTAIDKWVYDYPKEYETLMNDCNCGGSDEPIVMHVMPDSIKQPWESPLERIRIAKEQQEAGQYLISDVSELVYVPESNPFALLESIDEDLNQQKIEEIIAEQGGQAFRDYLYNHLTAEYFELVIQSSTVWYMHNDQQVYEKIKQASGANEEYLIGLSDGSIKVNSVDDKKFVSIFKGQIK
jgi:hypothetical protein